MFCLLSNNIDYKKQRIFRVIVQFVNGQYCTGSGFFIDKNGNFLTCFHVAFGLELKNLRIDPRFTMLTGADEHSRLEAFYRNNIAKTEIELRDGLKKEIKLEKFNEKYDIALLKLQEREMIIKYFEVDYLTNLYYGNEVFFCGFQYAVGYEPKQFPFTVNAGMVSAFPEIIIGGEKYQHIQINSINLGGNSGAPLFRKHSNKVVGIINGNMNWGSDNVAFVAENRNVEKKAFRIPLSIAYATPMKLLKAKTSIIP